MPPFRQQRPDGAAQDKLHQLVRRVERSRRFAGEGIGAERHARAGRHHVALQQPFVDGTELLHREVAVVDPLAAAFDLDPRHGIDQHCEHGVGQREASEQGALGVIEQAAVVGGQAEVGVAHGNRLEQGCQRRPPGFHAGSKPTSRRSGRQAQLPQAVGCVAFVPHRQQVAILGVQQKKQAIQQAQPGLPRVRPPHGIGDRPGRGIPRDGVNQIGEHMVEHDGGQRRRDPLFVQLPLGHRQFEEGAAFHRHRQQRGLPEQQQENPDPMVHVGTGRHFRTQVAEQRG